MAGERAIYLLKFEVARALERAVNEGLKGVGDQLEKFGEAMKVQPTQDMDRAHQDIAENMRQAVRSAYETNVENVRKVEPYTRSSRLSGHLSRVVRRKDLVTADAAGISFVDQNVMDKEAAHWRRLNFGAGEQAGPQSQPHPLRLFGEVLGTASLGEGPSRAFVLPKGFFIQGGKAVLPHSKYRGAGSEGRFVASRKSPYHPAVTVGIRGRQFLDAGLEVLERELPIRYSDLLNEWVQRGWESGSS